MAISLLIETHGDEIGDVLGEINEEGVEGINRADSRGEVDTVEESGGEIEVRVESGEEQFESLDLNEAKDPA